MILNMSTIGVRFDINKAGGGYYGFTCWKIFWQAITPEEIGVASLYEGDTAATLNGQERVFCIAVQSLDSAAIRKIKGALTRSEAFKQVCASPMFVEGSSCAAEPLPDAGTIDAEANLVGDARASRSALSAVRTAHAAATQPTREQLLREINSDSITIERLEELLEKVNNQLARYKEALNVVEKAGTDNWTYEVYTESLRIGGAGEVKPIERHLWEQMFTKHRLELRTSAISYMDEGRRNFERIKADVETVLSRQKEAMQKSSSVAQKEFLDISIGVETLGGTFTPILERGSTLPCEKTEVFSTAADNQPSLEIHVLRGDAKSVSDPSMRNVGRFTLKGIPPGRAGEPQIEVAFAVTSDGQFQLRAKDLITGHTIEVAGEDTDSDISEHDLTKRPEAILQKSSGSIGEAVGAGAFGGAIAGLAAHYLAGGKMTFPIFILAYLLILSGLKGWGKLVGLVVFTAVAALIVVLFQHL